jgi:hypothetical protein
VVGSLSINIKFYVKLGKNASNIREMLPEAYGGRSHEKVLLRGINCSKTVVRK